MQETEIKYIFQIEDLELIKPALKKIGAKIINDSIKNAHTVYFDSQKCRLRKAHLELRVRETNGLIVQTLKSTPTSPSPIFARMELEHHVSSMVPDLKLIENELKSNNIHRIADAHLHPVFKTEVERQTIEVKWKKCLFRIDIDNGKISSGRRKTRPRLIAELELELVKGTKGDLLKFAVELNEQLNLRLNGYSKADFGYALAIPRFALKPVKWEMVSGQLPADASLKSLLNAAFLQLVRNNPELLRDRLETIHQARVAIRRIRALLRGHKSQLDFLQRKGVNGELKWAQTKLGEARDWQVLQTESLPEILPHLSINPGMLETYVAKQTAHHLNSALAINSSRRFNRLLCRTHLWIESLPDKPRNDAKARLRRLRSDLRNFERLGRMPARDFPAKIHELRIRTKKIRYMLEINETDSHGDNDRLISEAKSLQSLLGKFNDLSKTLELLSPARTTELPVKMNSEIRKIIGDQMDHLYTLAKAQFKRFKSVIRRRN